MPVEDFCLTVRDHQFVSVVGSNGSGKTSMLNIICGSIPLDDGQIIIGGEDITRMPEYKRQRRIGRVYQNPAMGIYFIVDPDGYWLEIIPERG